MTTYIIYSNTTDGYIQSYHPTYTTALAGANLNLGTDSNGSIIATGQNLGGNGSKYVYAAYLSFDTQAITTTDEIVDVQMVQYSGWTQSGQKSQWGQQWYIQNWTAPLTTSQWINPQTFISRQANGIAVNFDILETATPYRYRFSGGDNLVNGVSKTAATKFVVVGNTAVLGIVPTGTNEIWMEKGARRPHMIVHTVAPSTLNSVQLASTSLSDGTTISIRSNGAASPTMTLGYSLLNGAWTSLGALNTDFTRNIDGTNSIAVVSDPADNFYVIGVKNGTKDALVAQGFKRLTNTTWQAQTPLSENIPAGNGMQIRSVAASYVTANRDSRDAPNIYVLTARGASGTRPAFPTHTGGLGGGGWTQDTMLFSENILRGSGALISGTVNAYSPHTATGIPVFTDIISIDGSVQAVYVQRGKFSNVEVGGISTINIYNRQGFTMFNDGKYVPTGASKLVPVDASSFAHVFDEDGKFLTVRFYNKQCQILGEARLEAENFTGGVIGEKWAASYDPISGVVRVYFMTSANGITLGRFDVSPVTFSGTVTASMATNFGASGTTTSVLRAPNGRADERRMMLEGANSTTANVKATSVYYSTVGNKVPSAPVITTRPNFDATSIADFSWVFSDANPSDRQTGYQIEISRTDTSAVVHDTGKVTSVTQTHNIAANVLTNGVNYRWRVRTYDAINAVGTWSAYGTFTTAATGTVTIQPTGNKEIVFDTSFYNLSWTYAQSQGQTQRKRRVVVTNESNNAVVLDTGMVTTTSTNLMLTDLSSGVYYRVEVYVENSAGITTPAAVRTLYPYYSEPMLPEVILVAFEEYIEVQVVNPTPLGSRPEVLENDIYRRVAKADEIPWVRIATIGNNSIYRDYAVKSEVSYEYQIVGRTS